MKGTLTPVLAVAALALSAGVAQAQVQDRKIQVRGDVGELYNAIVNTAESMCSEAIAKGWTMDQERCVDEVVVRTVRDARKPELTAHAHAMRPRILAVRLTD